MATMNLKVFKLAYLLPLEARGSMPPPSNLKMARLSSQNLLQV
jgi:hypothetical protein